MPAKFQNPSRLMRCPEAWSGVSFAAGAARPLPFSPGPHVFPVLLLSHQPHLLSHRTGVPRLPPSRRGAPPSLSCGQPPSETTLPMSPSQSLDEANTIQPSYASSDSVPVTKVDSVEEKVDLSHGGAALAYSSSTEGKTPAFDDPESKFLTGRRFFPPPLGGAGGRSRRPRLSRSGRKSADAGASRAQASWLSPSWVCF